MHDAGVTAAALAAAIGAAVDEVAEWERGTAQPTKTQFHKLAKFLKRPESFFFLARPPAHAPLNAAFRLKASGDVVATPTPDEAEALRRARNLQEVVAWLYEEMARPAPKIPRFNTTLEAEPVADHLREWLGWTLEYQTAADATEARASATMRDLLEKQSVVTFNVSLSAERVRGFSIPHPLAPLIGINTQDPHRARLFSYVHELAHLTLADNSICYTRENKGLESWCNRVAAAVLMPRENFRSYLLSRFKGAKVNSLEDVGTVKNRYKVSLRAVAIRAEQLGLASPGLYEMVNKTTDPKGRGRSSPDQRNDRPVHRIRAYGSSLISDFLDAEELGVISQFELLNLLRVSRAELNELRMITASPFVDAE